jgi:DNA-binding transcriptional MocR family regulator
MDILKASEIREILKVTVRPEVISFAGGLPAPELFPVDDLKRAAQAVLERSGREALQYSTTQGHLPLREAIALRMARAYGLTSSPDDVLVTSGSQQGLDLTAKLFLDDGDVVICESPTYIGMTQAFSAFRPRFVEVRMDDEGMVADDLERALRSHPDAKLIYTIPTFQNPTGNTWSAARRRAVMEIATAHEIPVIEDNPYGELRFEGEPAPLLKEFDPKRLVIYLGTFSKVFCPGLRLAWLQAQAPFVEKLVLLKQGADLHTSTFAQHLLAEYLATADIDANIDALRTLYRRRRNAMLETIASTFPSGVVHTRPQGGLFLWVELPPHVSARDVLAQSLERQVAFVPGGSFFPNGGHENTLRLNYSNMPEERIREGIERLALVLREIMVQSPA